MMQAIENLFYLVLQFLYSLTHSWGWSLVLFAALAKACLIPLTNSQFKAMREMQVLHPEMKRLQEKYKDNPQAFNKELQALFKARNVNPISGCFFSMLIQFPILYAIYDMVQDHIDKFITAQFLWIGPFGVKLASYFPGLTASLDSWRGFCSIGMHFQPSFPFLATNLGSPDWPLLLLYGISMTFFSRISGMGQAAVDPQTAQTQKMMNLILPVMMVFAFSNFPSAFILYWLVFNVFSIVHQALFNKLYQPQPLVIAQEKRRNTAHASNRANS